MDNKVTVYFGEKNSNLIHNNSFPNNRITTTKYNPLTLIPKSLFYQFKRANNIYFLIVTIFTCLSFSPKQPGSMIGTFAFVLIATMIKEAIEDYSRYKQDRMSNNRDVWLFKERMWVQVKCWTLRPGDIIKVEKDEEFSADTLIIKSNNDTGYCYIDTKNLDGETNLKEKAALEQFKEISEEMLGEIIGTIECEKPNENLTSWKGVIQTTEDFFADLKNIVLKGCVLKNTKYIIGIVVYSGSNTKIMKNSKKPRIKMSKVLLIMNKLLYSVFLFDILLCLLFAYLNVRFQINYEKTYTYIYPKESNINEIEKFFMNFLTFFVAYSHMIPISLYVALEIVKIIQGLLIYYDNEIYDYSINKPAACRATDLVEELGQVEFIFSDKTGTLTQNSMVLKKIFINGRVYGNTTDEDPESEFTINGDVQLYKKLKSSEEDSVEDKKLIYQFLYLLSLCHAVFPERDKSGKIIYQGASPDDIALVKGAQQIGIEFVEKEFSEMTIYNKIDDSSIKYDLKLLIPFDSDRKRMSVVVQNKQTGEYLVLSKGADTVMLERMHVNKKEKDEISRVIKVLSKEGLRVLILASKKISESFFLEWYDQFNIAQKIKVEDTYKLYDQLEINLDFLGCTAIEDKLQEGVSETIYTLITCNIRVWVLTGDKQDTAEEIAKSCKLINENMFLLSLVEDEYTAHEKLRNIIDTYNIQVDGDSIDLEEVFKKIRKKEGKDMSIIIDGYTLTSVLADEILSKQFFHIAISAKSVICCRVSPKQKSLVVQLAKKYGKWITLSIGDGANDVPMIMEAHIGVGIQGKEGTQAVRSADFSIGQFRFLEKLLLSYGRIGYVKVSKFICYYFYKNIILVVVDIFFAISNGFSGQIYFADYLSTLYNAFFTSWPCLFVFSLEKDVDLLIVKKFPMLYVAGQKNYFFNMKIFWSYILYSIFHGFVCFYIPNLGMNYFNDVTGITLSHWYKSTISFSLIIHTVTLKLLVISDFWNVLNLSATLVSLIFYYLCLLLLNTPAIAYVFQNELAGVFFNLLTLPKFWIVIVINPIFILLPDILLKQLIYSYKPIPTDYIKFHLNDQNLRNLVFNNEAQQQIFNSTRARKAEKVIQERLQKSRMKNRQEHSDTSMIENGNSAANISRNISNVNKMSNTNLNDYSENDVSKVSEDKISQPIDNIKIFLKSNTFAKRTSERKGEYSFHSDKSNKEICISNIASVDDKKEDIKENTLENFGDIENYIKTENEKRIETNNDQIIEYQEELIFDSYRD